MSYVLPPATEYEPTAHTQPASDGIADDPVVLTGVNVSPARVAGTDPRATDLARQALRYRRRQLRDRRDTRYPPFGAAIRESRIAADPGIEWEFCVRPRSECPAAGWLPPVLCVRLQGWAGTGLVLRSRSITRSVSAQGQSLQGYGMRGVARRPITARNGPRAGHKWGLLSPAMDTSGG